MRSLSGAGVAGVVLVIVIAWALGAVLMLTGTLRSAQDIDGRVKVINSQVVPVNQDLDAVQLARGTERLAGRIYREARPLSGQFDKIISATSGIDRRVGSILATVGSIDSTVGSIHDTVVVLNGTVGSLEATVSRLDAIVTTLGGRVRSIARTAGSIDETVVSIGGSVRGIHDRLAAVRRTVVSIDTGVAGINRHAGIVIDAVGAIRGDLRETLEVVTTAIEGHARSIDCRLNAETPSYCR